MTNIWQKIGKQIKSKRQQRGMTQAELGAKLGTQKAYIGNIENARQKCSLARLDEIAGALGCSLDVKINNE